MTESHDDRPDALAAKLLDARRSMRPLDPRDLGALASIEEAYAVQQRVARRLGPLGAFKAGRGAPDETPIVAPITAASVRRSPARFTRDELRLVGIELEVAFLVERALPPVDDPDFAEAARACVAPCAAIEVVDSRLVDPDGADELWKLADNQVNGGLVVAEPVGRGEAGSPRRRHARLTAGDEVLFDGDAALPGGDPFDVFVAGARLVERLYGGLEPGQFLTTGSLTGIVFLDFDVTVSGTIEGLGSVTVEAR